MMWENGRVQGVPGSRRVKSRDWLGAGLVELSIRLERVFVSTRSVARACRFNGRQKRNAATFMRDERAEKKPRRCRRS